MTASVPRLWVHDAAAHPRAAVLAGVGGVALGVAAGLAPLGSAQPLDDDAQVGPVVAGRTDDGVAVAAPALGHRAELLGELGLAGLPDRGARQLDEVVVVAVDDEARLGVVEAAALVGQARRGGPSSRRRSRRAGRRARAPMPCRCRRRGRRARPPSAAARPDDGGVTGAALRPRPVAVEGAAGELGRRRAGGPTRAGLHERRAVAAALALLGGGRRHLRVGGPGAAADDRPAVHPVDGVEEGRALGEAGGERVERVLLVDRVVHRPPLAALVDEDRVVAGADPAVAVHRQERRPADVGRRGRSCPPCRGTGRAGWWSARRRRCSR